MKKVIIDWPSNDVLHGERGVIVERPAPDEVLVRLDRVTSKMKQYEDSRTGLVTLSTLRVISNNGR